MDFFHELHSYPADFPVAVMKRPELSFPAHWHSEIEVIFVNDGHIRIGVNNEVMTIGKGEFAVCNSGSIHYFDSAGLKSEVTLILFRPEFIGFAQLLLQGLAFSSPFITYQLADCGNIKPYVQKEAAEIINSVFSEMKEKEKHYRLSVKGLLCNLCTLLMRGVLCAPVSTLTESRRLFNIRIMQEALEYIRNNSPDPITAGDVARHVNYSASHFSSVFKNITGASIKSFIDSVRLERAEEMIKNSNKPLVEICHECGFKSYRTFDRRFISAYGYPPSSLRK